MIIAILSGNFDNQLLIIVIINYYRLLMMSVKEFLMNEFELHKIDNVKEYFSIYDTNGEIIAGALLDNDNIIKYVVVRKDKRNLNYGTKLVKRIIHETVERPLILECDINLLGFFIKCGFLIVKIYLLPEGHMHYVLKHY